MCTHNFMHMFGVSAHFAVDMCVLDMCSTFTKHINFLTRNTCSFVWSLSHSDQTIFVEKTSENTKVKISGGGSAHYLHKHVSDAYTFFFLCMTSLMWLTIVWFTFSLMCDVR